MQTTLDGCFMSNTNLSGRTELSEDYTIQILKRKTNVAISPDFLLIFSCGQAHC